MLGEQRQDLNIREDHDELIEDVIVKAKPYMGALTLASQPPLLSFSQLLTLVSPSVQVKCALHRI